jgi:hypothetical protein
MSKKKFMEEVQAMPPPPPLSSNDDFPTIGLNELGRRLITEENEFIVPTEVKEEKLLLPPPPPPSSTKQAKKDETTTKQVKQDETTSTVQSNKKVRIVELILSMNYNKVNHKIILFGIILYIITK